MRQTPEGNLSRWSRESGSVTGRRSVGRCVDSGPLSDEAFISFQTLDKGLRTFFIRRQGKQRIPLATVEHGPRCLPPLFEPITRAGLGRERRAGRRARSPLLDVPGLHEVLQQRYHALELVIQGGQAFRRSAWGCASFPWHGRVVPERTNEGKEKARGNRWEDIRFMKTAEAFSFCPIILSPFRAWKPLPCFGRFRGIPAGKVRGLWYIWPPCRLHARPCAGPDH